MPNLSPLGLARELVFRGLFFRDDMRLLVGGKLPALVEIVLCILHPFPLAALLVLDGISRIRDLPIVKVTVAPKGNVRKSKFREVEKARERHNKPYASNIYHIPVDARPQFV
jgi:hypothetical protein